MTEPNPVYEAGPGGQCDDCGHFAMRHNPDGCHFPRPADDPCTCPGFLWLGQRILRPWEPLLADALKGTP